jgi:osmotically-inducible protein OsmY
LLREERPADAFQRFLLASKRHRLERLKAAGGTAVEVMTAPAITIRSDASAAEAARLLRRNLIKQLPVIDAAGRLVGIVSRSDVLKVFLRPDEEIRREILDQLFRGRSAPGPGRLQVSVRDGVVLLEGACERRSHIPVLVRAVAGVEGVVRVENRLGFDLDDLSSLPSTFSRSLL